MQGKRGAPEQVLILPPRTLVVASVRLTGRLLSSGKSTRATPQKWRPGATKVYSMTLLQVGAADDRAARPADV